MRFFYFRNYRKNFINYVTRMVNLVPAQKRIENTNMFLEKLEMDISKLGFLFGLK